MADSDKIITITPNTSVATTHPEIKFVGKDNSPMYLRVLDDNSLSFEGAEGQVFSMSPTMSSGDIFSVSDISGIQNIAVNADGTITMNAQTQSTTIKNNASNTATLILENTNADAIDGPILDLYRNDSANSGDGDDIGAIVWSANNDAGEKTNFGRIMMEPNDVSNGSEDGEMIFKLMEGGSDEQEYFRLRGGVRQFEINAGTDDIDFCYNSDATSNFFFINANTERMGINAGTSPNALLHIGGTTYIQSATANQLLRIHADTNSSPAPRIELMRGAHDTWGSGDNYTDWRITNENDLIFYSGFSTQSSGAAVERLRIHSDADGVTINNAYKLPASDGSANQVLQTDGSGTLSFADASSGGLSGGESVTYTHNTTPVLTLEQNSTLDNALILKLIGKNNEVLNVKNTGAVFFNLSAAGGGSSEGVLTYRDTAGTARTFLSIDGGTIIHNNRGPNGDLEFRANNSTAGASGEVVKAQIKHDQVVIKSKVYGDVVVASSNTVLTQAQSGARVLWTPPAVLTLPADPEVGTHYYIWNLSSQDTSVTFGTGDSVLSTLQSGQAAPIKAGFTLEWVYVGNNEWVWSK